MIKPIYTNYIRAAKAGQTPLALYALLLFTFPLLFTLNTLLLLPELGDLNKFTLNNYIFNLVIPTLIKYPLDNLILNISYNYYNHIFYL